MSPKPFLRPTWAEVSLPDLRSNLKRLRRRLPARTRLLFVVKGDAYGHGALACSRCAQGSGVVDWLGVSSVEEGAALRDGGIRLPILVLGSLYPFESFRAAAFYGLAPTVASLESARRLAAMMRRLGRRAECHLKVETGMGRIGMTPRSALEALGFLSSRREVRVGGVYTHFACAETSRAFTEMQLGRFTRFLSAAASLGLRVGIRHAANSAAAMEHPASRLDMVRPGLAAYGLYGGFKPVLTLKTKIVFIKTVKTGTPIGYGATFRARRRSRIATIPVGYADGFSRGLSNKGSVLVRGAKCPVVGNVAMDMTMIDVTRAPGTHVGDEVVLIGASGGQSITAAEMARALGTIPYEVACSISGRVPRVHLP
ncbi:MAG: alanine racemase [Elusimicrobia bacterium]|nr:alanine racemase [Elusimicrobiota bacterium]